MDYSQERVATLHDFGAADPPAATDEAAVVVPMTEREYESLAAERVLEALGAVEPAQVYVPLRAPPGRVPTVADWLASFDLPLTVLWCSGPRLGDVLADASLEGAVGKGRDVWLALGIAATDHPRVACHDADVTTYEARDVRKLLYPLEHGYRFSKGYYARVENDRLYGRLCRLFYAPLVATLQDANDAAVLDYLAAFRYALAGEFAMSADLAASMRVPRRWGLEVGILVEAFGAAGVEATAQVDLGRYGHEHRSVGGPGGLSAMSEAVARTLFRTVGEHGATPDYETLPERYRETASRYVRAYAADAGFNELAFDEGDERRQVEIYADAIRAPEADTRLPAWAEAPIEPGDVRAAAAADLEAAREGERS